jgi:hypothetical protein
MRKVVYFSFLKNYDKGDHHTLLYTWGATMLDHIKLHQIWTMASLQVACA